MPSGRRGLSHASVAKTAVDAASAASDLLAPDLALNYGSPEMAVSIASRSPAGGIGNMLVATFCFALMDAMSKHLTMAYSPVEILWVRFVCFTIFAVAISGGPTASARALAAVASVGVQVLRAILLTVEMALFVLALRYMGIADAHVLLATGPLVVTGLAVVMLGERVGIRRWAAIVAGLAGVVLVVGPEGELGNLGSVYMAGCVLLFAFYQVLTRKAGATDSARASLLHVAGGGLAVLSLAVPFIWATPSPFDLGVMVGLGFLGAFAHFMLIRAFEAAPASVLQPLFYSTLVWALPVGFLIYGHVPAPVTLIGASIIVGSGLYALHRERAREQALAPDRPV